ncbi:2503_t:CDS:2, partial [Cetraspora pellucida]
GSSGFSIDGRSTPSNSLVTFQMSNMIWYYNGIEVLPPGAQMDWKRNYGPKRRLEDSRISLLPCLGLRYKLSDLPSKIKMRSETAVIEVLIEQTTYVKGLILDVDFVEFLKSIEELKAPRGLCFDIERSFSQLLDVPATIPAVQYLVVNNDDTCTYILSFIGKEEMVVSILHVISKEKKYYSNRKIGPETIRSLRGVMCLEKDSDIGIVVGNKFSGGAIEEAEKSKECPLS